jgi:hypothetical protein
MPACKTEVSQDFLSGVRDFYEMVCDLRVEILITLNVP